MSRDGKELAEQDVEVGEVVSVCCSLNVGEDWSANVLKELPEGLRDKRKDFGF